MRCLPLLLFLLAVLPVAAQTATDNIDDKKVEQLLQKVAQQQATEADKKELEAIALQYQNKSQDLDPKRFQFKKSIAATDRAIALFTALNDTLNAANNHTFKGYLLGRFEKFAEAKKETHAAIYLYDLLHMNAAVAIAQFDLARMFEFENKTDSALYYAGIARRYWQTKQGDLRVLIINNMEVSLLLKTNQPEKAKAIQASSEMLVNKPDMHWQAVIDYYFTSMLLYRALNDIGTAGSYQQLYLSKIAGLRSAGMVVKSYYENDR